MEWFKTLLEMTGNITGLTQKLNIKDKIQRLKRKMETLASRDADIRTQLAVEEMRPGKKRKEEVKDWSKNFERLSCEVNKAASSTSFWQLTLGSSLDKLIREAEKLYEEGRFVEGLTLDMCETRGYEVPIGKLVGRAFQSNLEKIWNYLRSEEVHSIGVEGMGGVGKTALVKCIHNQIVNDCVTFEGSCWVTVSQDCSVWKLQNAIAKHLHLDLENEKDEMIRAGRLCNVLKMRLMSRKFIIILDDVWEYYPLEKLGIPLGRDGCKLILTTRNKDICHQMNCNKLVEVATLPKQEAWCLFRDNLGCGTQLSQDVEEIAQAVAVECAGLPLGLVVLSGIMRQVNDIHEWQNTLEELRESKFRAKRIEDEVFTVLRFSYHRLGDNIMQQCFLHVALYPEDEVVKKEELIQYFIDSRLIERKRTRRAEFEKGDIILNRLVNCRLLEKDTIVPHTVRMHDLVRDMGINVTNGRFMVKAGQRLREFPHGIEWVESLEKVSLMDNNIKEISVDTSLRFSNISSLFLQRNPLISIADSFFRHMQTLQILNLSRTDIKELPDSFSDLENLTTLYLNDCPRLRSMPSLAKMRALKTLNLKRSGIVKMPQGMERLHSLLYLDLGKTKGLERKQWPSGILPQLSHLQYLDFMGGPKIMEVEELMSLSKLECLRCWFDDAYRFSTCMKYLQTRTPHVGHWDITLGANHSSRGTIFGTSFIFDIKKMTIAKCNMEGRDESIQLSDDMDELYLDRCQGVTSMSQWGTTFLKLKKCGIYECKGMEAVINDSQQCSLFPELRYLILSNLRDLREMISNSLQPIMTPRIGNFFSSLTSLEIHGCPRIKKLLTPLLMPLLTHVENMSVAECEELEEIIAVEDNDHYGCILTLPKLRYMELNKLPQLKRICKAKWMMKCDSLRLLFISECSKLERIPMELHIPSDHHQEENPIPSSLVQVTISSVPGWSDTEWRKR